MSILLSCNGVQKSIGAQLLFQDLSFGVFDKDRIGLVGRNGTGKSTLLKILANELEPDAGSVTARKSLRVSFVEQVSEFPAGLSVRQVVMDAVGRAEIPFESLELAAAKALSLAGFDSPETKVDTLSGGWRKRLALASALATEPDVILLDEPTNHLDYEGLTWLESLLLSSEFAWVLITHDRYILERTAKKIVELDQCYEQGLLQVEGNYSDFVRTRDDYLQQLNEQQARVKNRLGREEEWMRRQPKARGTKAQGRIKSVIELREVDQNLSRRLSKSDVEIDFDSTLRKTKDLLELDSVSLIREGRSLFRDLSVKLHPKQKLGLLGPNGCGKSSLLKLIKGDLLPDSGERRQASNLRVVYFDQQRESLSPSDTLSQALVESGDQVVYQGKPYHVVSWASRFAFRPEQLNSPVSALSGGEQARLVLAKMLLEPADVLLLDEPTNDLDIYSREKLEEAIGNFVGAVVLVTHDRYMLDNVVTSYLGFLPDGQLRHYSTREQWEREVVGKPRAGGEVAPKRAKPSRVAGIKLSYKEQKEYDSMESAIAEAEKAQELAKEEVDRACASGDSDRMQVSCGELDRASRRVEELFARWEELEARQAR